MKAVPQHSHLCLEPESCPVLSTPQWFAPMKPIRQSGSTLISSLIYALSSSLHSNHGRLWIVPWIYHALVHRCPCWCSYSGSFFSSISWPPYVCLPQTSLNCPLPKEAFPDTSSKESSSPHIVSAFSFLLFSFLPTPSRNTSSTRQESFLLSDIIRTIIRTIRWFGK